MYGCYRTSKSKGFKILDSKGLGFISPFVLIAKNIFQELCKFNYGWDKNLPENYAQLWQEWMMGLDCIKFL